MTTLAAVTGKQLLAALSRVGSTLIRVRGSHHYVRHPDGRATVVPIHSGETLGPGLLSKIFRDIEISRDQLQELL